uniref:Homeobox domain-containing protein n=1 Tax=Rhabditophanes sp. KR3021 TaxID=114890 RepID=A0AC35UBC9_9BILA
MNIPSTPSSTSAGNNTPTCSESNHNSSTLNGHTTLTNCRSSTPSSSGDNDHLQRLAQMTQGVGMSKDSAATADPSLYQSAAAAAYVNQYGSWQNAYYQQFSQPMNPATAFWPGAYPPAPHWSSYAQTKKGRQTYQRFQTSVLESKFQVSSYVSKKQREELRVATNLTDRQIKIWFQNRRMKQKKEKTRVLDDGENGSLLPANPPKQLGHGSHMGHPGNNQNGQQLMHMNNHTQRQDNLSDAAAAAAAAGFNLMSPWGSSMNNSLMGSGDPNSMLGGQNHHMGMVYPGNSAAAAAYGMSNYPGALCPPNI